MSASEVTGPPWRIQAQLWRNRSFCWLLVTSSISFFGNQFSLVAIPWLALRVSGSPEILAATIAAMAVPQVAFVLIGGATADRHSPRTILTVANCVNAIVLAALAATTASGLLRIYMLIGLTLLSGTAAAFAIPATNSLLPRIVAPKMLASANSLLVISRQITMLVGPVVAGTLITWVTSVTDRLPSVPFAETRGVSIALAIAAIGFLVASCTARFIRSTSRALPISHSVLDSLIEGLRWVWNDRPLRTLLLYYGAMLLLVAGPWQVGLPLLADRHLHHGTAALGILLAAGGVGTIIGMTIAGLRRTRWMATLGTIILATDILASASLIALSHTRSMVTAAILCTVMGLGGGYTQVGVVTWIQQRTPLAMLGRTMSVMTLTLLGTAPISAAVTGLLLTHFAIVPILTTCGSLLLLIAVLCLSNTTLRSIDPKTPSSSVSHT